MTRHRDCWRFGTGARSDGSASGRGRTSIDYARANGATTLEAYPVDAGDGRLPAAEAYRGTLGMFERVGFSVVAGRQWNDSSPVRPIVRFELATTAE